jgi:hypothetical protein
MLAWRFALQPLERSAVVVATPLWQLLTATMTVASRQQPEKMPWQLQSRYRTWQELSQLALSCWLPVVASAAAASTAIATATAHGVRRLPERACAEKLAQQHQREQLAAQSSWWRQISKEHPQLLLQVRQQLRKPEQKWKKQRAHLLL